MYLLLRTLRQLGVLCVGHALASIVLHLDIRCCDCSELVCDRWDLSWSSFAEYAVHEDLLTWMERSLYEQQSEYKT